MSSLNSSLSYGCLYNGNKLRERPNTTLTTVFNRDLASITHPIRLHLCKDLAEITDLAPGQESREWEGGCIESHRRLRKLPKCYRLRTEARYCSRSYGNEAMEMDQGNECINKKKNKDSRFFLNIQVTKPYFNRTNKHRTNATNPPPPHTHIESSHILPPRLPPPPPPPPRLPHTHISLSSKWHKFKVFGY